MGKNKNVQTLRRDNQQEIPLIEQLLTVVPKIQTAQIKCNCQVKALIKYHMACARAARTLAEDINKCQ